MPLLLIHTNCPDAALARRIGTTLVDERLVACWNLGARIASGYRWNGVVVEEAEVPLLLKTRPALWPRVADRIRDLHPHEVPAIWGTLADMVDPAYLHWVESETVSGES